MSETTEQEAATGRVVMRIVDYYWSERLKRVVTVYRCSVCGKNEADLNMKKPEIERTHVCA